MIKTNITKLAPPCSYQGGKQRVAKEIVDYILNTTFFTNNAKFYDLCCGSGAITIELLNRGIPPKKIVMCDKSSWGVFWESVGNGAFDLNKFYTYSKAVPRDKSLIQNHMKELSLTNADIDEAYKYILLQSSSFGGKQIWNTDGKWQNTSFRDYWQPTETSKRKTPVNPMQPMVDVIENRVEHITNNCKGLTCYHKDIYEMLPIIQADKSEYQPECTSDITTIYKEDYLTANIRYLYGRLVIGNPPYGEHMNMAQKFFKKSVQIADYIAFILPISQLNNTCSMYEFDLVYSEGLGIRQYSDRKLHCCFNIYKRPDNGELNKKPSSKLNDISIYRQDSSNYDKRDFDIRMCYWGDGTAGKILNDTEHYSAEYKIKIHNEELKDEITDCLIHFDWKSYLNCIAMRKIQQFHIIDVLKENVKGIK